MIYTIDITTPANTSKANLITSVLDITKGLIYQVEIEFPSGAAGLHYVALFDGGFQIYPSTNEQWFHSDNVVITFQDTYLKLIEPYKILIKTYNLDDTYEHRIQVRVGLVSKDIFLARFLPSYNYKYFQSMLENLQVEQEAQRKERLKQGLTFINSEEPE